MRYHSIGNCKNDFLGDPRPFQNNQIVKFTKRYTKLKGTSLAHTRKVFLYFHFVTGGGGADCDLTCGRLHEEGGTHGTPTPFGGEGRGCRTGDGIYWPL